MRTGVALGLVAPAVEEHVRRGRVHGLRADWADMAVVEAVPGAVVDPAVARVVPAAQAAVVVGHREEVVAGRDVLMRQRAGVSAAINKGSKPKQQSYPR